MVHAKMHNFFINRITDPTELSMPIEDMHQVSLERRKWNETQVAMVTLMMEQWSNDDVMMPMKNVEINQGYVIAKVIAIICNPDCNYNCKCRLQSLFASPLPNARIAIMFAIDCNRVCN
jgi:hypothetical protein